MVDLPVKVIYCRKWIILKEIDDNFIFRAFDGIVPYTTDGKGVPNDRFLNFQVFYPI